METLKNLTLVQWFGIIILFNTTLLGGAGQLGDLSLSPGIVKALLAVATLGNGFLGGLVTMFGGLGTQAQNVVAGGASVAVKRGADSRLVALAQDPAENGIAPTPASGL